ncbi:MAG: VWA domain-containing protein [Pseudomonadota bacterium]
MTYQGFAIALIAAGVLTACQSKEIERTEAEVAPAETAQEETAALDSITVTGSTSLNRVRQTPQFSGLTSADVAGVPAPPPPPPSPLLQAEPVDRERFEDVEINPVKLVSEEPVSTFSIDVDTASYAVARRYLNDGVLPPTDAIRIEELINYFDYTYPRPEEDGHPFATHVTVTPSPWAEGRDLIHIGVQGYDLVPEERPPLNLTLLVDVSGSMNSPDKLPLARNALKLLVDQMDENDTISIVVYASAAGTVLEPTPGNEKTRILGALDNLSAGGSTAGGEGLRRAYALAEQSFIEDGVNRIMMVTDGDFNVGITQDERLEDFVTRKRESGVYLSVMGFGRGNYNDQLMQTIAQAGNGTAGYIDTLAEARKWMDDDLSSNLFPIADDVKIQVEFNPAAVAEYRLIGYETRILNREDFNNDQVDAGDIGAGASVTAIYEITPVGSDARQIDPSRYATAEPAIGITEELAFLKLRYKRPGEDDSTLVTEPIMATARLASLRDANGTVRFSTAVAAYGQMLRTDPYMSDSFGWDEIIGLANSAKGPDEFGYRAEFVQLARSARTAAAQATLETGSSGEGAG